MATRQPATASASATSASVTSAVAPSRPLLSSRHWRRGAFLLAAAAQLITISALLSVDPLAATWSPLLLAIAPAPLTALAAFTSRAVAIPAALVAAVAILVGVVGGIGRIGSLFIPALIVLVVGVVLGLREPR